MPSNIYVPDRWTVLQVTGVAGDRHFRILASWYGGFLGSDSWKMSSGITKIEQEQGQYRVHNDSGSVYICRKGAEGMSAYTASVLNNYQGRARAAGASINQIESIEEVKL